MHISLAFRAGKAYFLAVTCYVATVADWPLGTCMFVYVEFG